jgi:hypothetical protein
MGMSNKPAHAMSDPDGPFRARQIRDGDPYELSNGHPIKCMSAGERHGKANLQGALSLSTDPGIQGQAGIDVGIEFNDGKNLRAPDLVLGIEGKAGWSKTVPPICVEYADRGQDEVQLKEKIAELLEAGVKYIWVVRLAGPLHVEVHEQGKKMRIVSADESLTAPGVLVNSYTPRELVDQKEALRVSFRNQLQTLGYNSLEDVRSEGRLEEARINVYDLCEVLGLKLSEARRKSIEQMDRSALSALRQAIKKDRRWPR